MQLSLIDCKALTDYSGMVLDLPWITGIVNSVELQQLLSISQIIGGFCTKLRELDLTNCGHFSDVCILLTLIHSYIHTYKHKAIIFIYVSQSVVHTLAPRVSCLTLLRLDGNRNVTTRGLLTHIGKEVILCIVCTF
jgi:hypothetical protein